MDLSISRPPPAAPTARAAFPEERSSLVPGGKALIGILVGVAVTPPDLSTRPVELAAYRSIEAATSGLHRKAQTSQPRCHAMSAGKCRQTPLLRESSSARYFVFCRRGPKRVGTRLRDAWEGKNSQYYTPITRTRSQTFKGSPRHLATKARRRTSDRSENGSQDAAVLTNDPSARSNVQAARADCRSP